MLRDSAEPWMLGPDPQEPGAIRAWPCLNVRREVTLRNVSDIPSDSLWSYGPTEGLRPFVELCVRRGAQARVFEASGLGDRRTWSLKFDLAPWLTIRPASTWTEGGPSEAGEKLARLLAAAEEVAGGRRIDTPAQLARLFASKFLPGRDVPCPPAVRSLFRLAVHGGPVACLRLGDNRGVVQIDRVGAYLESMSAVRVCSDNRRWTHETSPGVFRVLRLAQLAERGIVVGVVVAELNIKPDGFFPPAPARVFDAARGEAVSAHPTGKVKGAWTLGYVGYLLSLGAELVSVREAAWTMSTDSTADLVSAIREVKDPDLRKAIYTRAWGVLGSRGGFEGHLPSPHDGWRRKEWDGWTWRATASPFRDTVNGASPFDRPDVAASVVADNMRRVVDMARRVPMEGLQALHVDAVWADRSILATLGDGERDAWKVKHDGRVEHFGVGVYIERGEGRGRPTIEVGSAGKPCRTAAEVTAYGQTLKRPAGYSWKEYPHATPLHNALCLPSIPAPGPFDRKGWIRKGGEHE